MTDLHALVAPYAIDAIDDLDRRRFQAHLLECESCRAELPGLAVTAAILASAQATRPPVHLRSQILSTAAAVPQHRTFTHDRRRAWRRLLPAMVAAAALVVPTAAAADYVAEQHSTAQERARTASVSAVLAAPDAATRSRSVVGGGTVRVVTSRIRGSALVAADHLPPLPKGQTYQVWTLAPYGATDRGVFSSSTVLTADRLGSADRIAVTVEPDGGSVRPTSLPIAVLPL